MVISKTAQFVLSGIVISSWCKAYMIITNKTQGGILNVALRLIQISTPEQTLDNFKKQGGFIELNDRQRANVASLKARLGVTRNIEFVWIDKETRDMRLAYAGSSHDRKLCDHDSLMVSGTHWSNDYPAVIHIRTEEILRNLDLPHASSAHTTKLLHEIAHIKRRDGKNYRKKILWSLCLHVTSIAAGFFAGNRTQLDFGLINGPMFGLGSGMLAGSILSNLVVGLMTLRQEQKTEEMALRASTAEELNPHIFGDSLAISCETPYWKYPLIPGHLWYDPPSVNIKKAKKIQKEKLIQNGTWEDDSEYIQAAPRSDTK